MEYICGNHLIVFILINKYNMKPSTEVPLNLLLDAMHRHNNDDLLHTVTQRDGNIVEMLIHKSII